MIELTRRKTSSRKVDLVTKRCDYANAKTRLIGSLALSEVTVYASTVTASASINNLYKESLIYSTSSTCLIKVTSYMTCITCCIDLNRLNLHRIMGIGTVVPRHCPACLDRMPGTSLGAPRHVIPFCHLIRRSYLRPAIP